ncbi:MAG: ARPP-1 family domain-containing protein [Gemmatimonadaceae bacterium]
MSAIKQLQERVHVADPFTRRNLAVFPILDEQAPATADYLPFGQAQKTGMIRVTEVSEGGSVPQLAVETLGGKAVILLDGEELIGARQNRIVNLTILAAGKTTVVIPVSCVERGRWAYRSRDFTESPRTMYPRARAQKMMDVSASLRDHGARHSDQGAVWEDVSRRARELASHSPTDAMGDIYDHHRGSIEDYLHDIVWLDGQVGAAFAIDGYVVGLDVFDSQNIAREYLPKVIRSYALDALAHPSARTAKAGFRPASAVEVLDLIEQVCNADAQTFPAVALGTDVRIDSRDLAGAALVRDESVVHLSAFRKSITRRDDGDGNGRGRVRRPSGPVSRTANPPRPAPGQLMPETHPIEIIRDHLLLRLDGGLALIDTGSPVSIGRGSSLTLQEREWTPSIATRFALDAASEHLGTHVEWLFGHDIIKAHPLLLDWRRQRARVGRFRYNRRSAVVHPVEFAMGIPIIQASHQGAPIRAVLDTGAALSYAPESAIAGCAATGRHRDFFPGVGDFETQTWSVPVRFGEREVAVSVGTLPMQLQLLFSMLLGPEGWIIGSDFFRDRAVYVDYRRGEVVDVTPAPAGE